MKEQGLISAYTVKEYRIVSRRCNEAKEENRVDRNFFGKSKKEVLVSDLTYVQVGDSSGLTRDAQPVQRALCKIKGSPHDNAVAEAQFKCINRICISKEGSIAKAIGVRF